MQIVPHYIILLTWSFAFHPHIYKHMIAITVSVRIIIQQSKANSHCEEVYKKDQINIRKLQSSYSEEIAFFTTILIIKSLKH